MGFQLSYGRKQNAANFTWHCHGDLVPPDPLFIGFHGLCAGGGTRFGDVPASSASGLVVSPTMVTPAIHLPHA